MERWEPSGWGQTGISLINTHVALGLADSTLQTAHKDIAADAHYNPVAKTTCKTIN